MTEHRSRANDKGSQPIPIVPGFIETRAGPLEIATTGRGTGPVLLLLSHGLGDWSTFADVATDLVDADPQLRVISYSRPGCGGTPGIGATSDPLHYEASVILPALLDELQISSVHMLGHADGASVALIFAGLFPDRTLSVLALAPYSLSDAHLRRSLEAMPLWNEGSALLSKIRGGVGHQDVAYTRWRHNRLMECDSKWNLIAFLNSVSAPVTLVQGMHDEFFSLDQMTAIADRIAGQLSWITLQNSGHLLHIEHPEQVTSLVQRQITHCPEHAVQRSMRGSRAKKKVDALSTRPANGSIGVPSLDRRLAEFCH